MRNIIFFVEGVHDVNCIAKILLMEAFEEIENVSKLPQIWKIRIPRAYPFIDDKLDRHIPMPAYFIKDNLCVVIISCNGATNIINDMDLYLSNMTKNEIKQINSVCVIFDADRKSAQEAFEDKFKKYNKDVTIHKKDFLVGHCRIRGEIINLYHYFFPDNNSKGNLEDFLLSGATVVYRDLLDYVDEYINCIDEKYKYNWTVSSENKVRVGCIANIFRPGSANQISIKHDDWISEDSIKYSFVIKKFYDFIINIID